MTTSSESTDTCPPAGRRAGAVRSWLLVALGVWTVLAALLVVWLVQRAAGDRQEVIRLTPGEGKPWMERLGEFAALARLNFHWAIAWCLLAPHVVWLGVRFHFDWCRWRTRIPILLVAGAGFVAFSSWFAGRISPRQAVVVMVNYSAVQTGQAPEAATNITRKVVVRTYGAGDTGALVDGPARGPAAKNWEDVVAREISDVPGASEHSPMLPPVLHDLMAPKLPDRPVGGVRGWQPVLDAFAFVSLLGLAHAGVFHRRYREREQQAVALQAHLNDARLRALQAQLQPHFLFNTLNGIATLLRRDPAAAEEMLTSLSELLRVALSASSRQEIPLSEELGFLDRYLEIQRMRFGDRLECKRDAAPEALSCPVPALLLQPLVENAIRHGIEPMGTPGWIHIGARVDGTQLRIVVEDNGVGLIGRSTDRTSSGMGLANVRERLRALHGEKQEVRIESPASGGFAVHISLPATGGVRSSSRSPFQP